MADERIQVYESKMTKTLDGSIVNTAHGKFTGTKVLV